MTEREARTTLKEEVQASGCTMACHLQSHPRRLCSTSTKAYDSAIMQWAISKKSVADCLTMSPGVSGVGKRRGQR